MPILDGIFGFPAKVRGEMGPAVVGRLLRVATKAGRVVSSLISVDTSGNLSTPGRIAASTATVLADAYASWFGHGANVTSTNGYSAPFNRFGFFQTPDGQIGIQAEDDTWIILNLNTASKGSIIATMDEHGLSIGRGGASASREPSAALQVSAGSSNEGGFLPPKMSVANRNAITSPTAGLIIYNSENARLELYDGSAWVGITTEP